MTNDQNVCRFTPVKTGSSDIQTLNFVYEKTDVFHDRFRTLSAYTLGLVSGGAGVLHSLHGSNSLTPGTVFLTFPAAPFRLEDTGNLRYLYVTFLGIRTEQILERLSISRSHPTRSGFSYLIPFWKDSLSLSRPQTLDLLAEGVLLYTFANLGADLFPEQEPSISPLTPIKQYLDEHSADSELTLEAVSRRFSYSPKYLSNLFRESLHIGFSEYLQTLRIQRACELMQQGITSVQNVAALSGYRDPLYFSRVFKKKMGVSPTQHIRQLKAQQA